MNAEQIKAMFCVDRIVWGALTSRLDKPEKNREPASQRWTIRDVYINFARWLNHSNAYIEAYCAGDKGPLGVTSKETNIHWQQDDNHMSLDDAREKARKAFLRRLDIIGCKPLCRKSKEASPHLKTESLLCSKWRLFL